MKLLLFLLSLSCFSQVGINTTNPTATLDVNGDLRVREIPYGSGTDLQTDPNGNIVQANPEYTVESFCNNRVIISTAANGAFQNNNVDLNVSVTLTVLPNTTIRTLIIYESSLGVYSNQHDVGGYLGLRLLKDGTEIDFGKFMIPASNRNGSEAVYPMGEITGTFIDTTPNPTNDPITVTYRLVGYIEQYYSIRPSGENTTQYILGRWGTTNNYNWKIARLQVSVD